MSTAPDTRLFANAPNAVAFAAGETIFQRGEPGDCMYGVQEGEVDLVVDGHVVETVGPGGFFGELSLLDSEPRSTSAVARTGCRLAQIDAAGFMFMVRQTPFFAMTVMRTLARRLRAMDARLEQ
jgi:CRP/FNR family cyclic AMP-dependent transcriptional regulator